MEISRTHIRKLLLIGLLLAALLVAGCAGIEPYEPRDNREEGMEKGLFTGSEGEFVIYRQADEPEEAETSKRSDETADGEQQELSSEEKKTKNKAGEQQP